jgi:1-acyl-sn-glycerol-3-phosphate acyltransferase
MKKIYEDSFGYTCLRTLADPYIHHSFKKLRYDGKEKIPKEGALIFASNHCAALMDPLAVLSITPEKKVFVARADIFRKPLLQKILTYFKIMPINRVRDGLRSVLNAEETIEKSIEVLNNHTPFCILPEGMHRPMHSLLPLGKGLSRVALGAYKTIQDGRHVYIVPVGCEYGDYYRYRTTLLATVGEPIDVTEYIEAHPERSEQELLVDIRRLTAEALKQDIVYIPDDDDYAATWELAKLSSGSIPERKLRERLDANRRTAGLLGKLREEQPEKARQLFEKAAAFTRRRKEARVSLHAVHAKRPLGSALWNTLKALFYLPFALVLGTASLPGWGLAEYFASKPKDTAFRNSLRCTVFIIEWTLLMLITAIVLLCTVKWYWALAIVAVLIPAPLLIYEYFELVRRCVSSWRYLRNGELKRQKEELLNELNNL